MWPAVKSARQKLTIVASSLQIRAEMVVAMALRVERKGRKLSEPEEISGERERQS